MGYDAVKLLMHSNFSIFL